MRVALIEKNMATCSYSQNIEPSSGLKLVLDRFFENWITFCHFLTPAHYVHIVDHSRVRVWKNLLMNRPSLINDSINYERLNLSKDTYKIKCKEKLLSWLTIELKQWHTNDHFLNANYFTMKWIFLLKKTQLNNNDNGMRMNISQK